MPSQKQRIERLNEILRILKDNKGKMKKSKLYGTLVLTFGLTQRTFDDYLDALESADQIKKPQVSLIGVDPEITLVSTKEKK